jgi:intracellular multiplication protein IcmK
MRMSRSNLPFLLKSTKLTLLGSACFVAMGFLATSAMAQGSTDPFAPPPALPVGNDALPAGQDSQAIDDSFTFEKTPEELEEEAREEAFDAALQGLLPLRPEEIRTLLERFDRTQESVSIPIYPDPKPEVTVQHIPLDPGVAPVTVKTSYGHVTTINILDSTGGQWPIEDITWAGDFEVIETQLSIPDTLPNILRITPQSEYATGNMSIKLLDLPTPIILRLDTSRDIVHYRFDAVIPEVGPYGKVPIIDAGLTINAGGQDMTSILEGVIPSGAERLNVAGADSRTRAYDYNGITILRTPFSLLSPAWEASASSADGTRVYAFQQTPVVLLSENGKMLRVRLSSRGDILDE